MFGRVLSVAFLALTIPTFAWAQDIKRSQIYETCTRSTGGKPAALAVCTRAEADRQDVEIGKLYHEISRKSEYKAMLEFQYSHSQWLDMRDKRCAQISLAAADAESRIAAVRCRLEMTEDRLRDMGHQVEALRTERGVPNADGKAAP